MELDAKLAACTDEAEKRRISGALAERETRVIGVYRQVKNIVLLLRIILKDGRQRGRRRQ